MCSHRISLSIRITKLTITLLNISSNNLGSSITINLIIKTLKALTSQVKGQFKNKRSSDPYSKVIKLFLKNIPNLKIANSISYHKISEFKIKFFRFQLLHQELFHRLARSLLDVKWRNLMLLSSWTLPSSFTQNY